MELERTVKRSQIYLNTFDDEFMMSVFGTLRPTSQERTKYFLDCWLNWKDNSIRFKPVRARATAIEIRRFCNGMGMKDLRDFQVKNHEIRFKSKEDLAMAKLNGIEVILNV